MSVEDSDAPHIVFCGGGSGGHLVPSIAVLESLRELDSRWTATFLCSGRDVDRRILGSIDAPDRVVQLPILSARPRLRYAVQVLRAIRCCRRELQRSSRSVVLGTGGFASVPGVLAAHWDRLPVALLEPNAVMGRANRKLRKHACVTFRGWGTLSTPDASELVTGVPIRAPAVRSRRRDDRRTLLITGGSLGARRLNELVLDAATTVDLSEWRIIHQTGLEDERSCRERWSQLSCDVRVVSFLDDLAAAFQSADLIVARGGAVTLAEIAATGTASILVPLDGSADDHQRLNAECLSSCGAAALVAAGDAPGMAAVVRQLTCDDVARESLGAAVRAMARPGAARVIAEKLQGLVT